MNVIGRKVTKIFDMKDDEAMIFYDETMKSDEFNVIYRLIVSSPHRVIVK